MCFQMFNRCNQIKYNTLYDKFQYYTVQRSVWQPHLVYVKLLRISTQRPFHEHDLPWLFKKTSDMNLLGMWIRLRKSLLSVPNLHEYLTLNVGVICATYLPVKIWKNLNKYWSKILFKNWIYNYLGFIFHSRIMGYKIIRYIFIWTIIGCNICSPVF